MASSVNSLAAYSHDYYPASELEVSMTYRLSENHLKLNKGLKKRS